MIDDNGKIFSWEVANDSSVDIQKIHKDFEASKFNSYKVAALAYLPKPELLFSASKRRIYVTNINSGKHVNQFDLVSMMEDEMC